MIPGLDYSTARPVPIDIYNAGFRFVGRYGGIGGPNKRLTLTEARSLSAAGLHIVALCEGTENWMLGGRTAGRTAAAAAALEFALCGMPADRPVYFACDIDVTEAEWPKVEACLVGACEVLGLHRVGLYGGTRALRWAKSNSVAAWFWQATGWRIGDWESYAHVRQTAISRILDGSDVDYDQAVTVDYGQWIVDGGLSTMTDPDVSALEWREKAEVAGDDTVTGGPTKGEPVFEVQALHRIETKLDTLGSVLAGEELPRVIADVRDGLHTLINKPAAVVDAEAFFVAAEPRLSAIVRQAVAEVLDKGVADTEGAR